MSDDLDNASDTEMLFNRIAIEQAKHSAPKLQATGFCLWCEEEVEVGRRFCDADCRTDYERFGRK